MKERLKIENLNKFFGDKQVLKDINFSVYEGEFLSVLGPSGCGKTTLIRILLGLEKPSSGAIYKDGEEITNLCPSKRGMGIVFQSYALFENMTVEGNVEYALKIKSETKKGAKERADFVIEQLGLTECRNKKPSELSGGWQQRVAIARALAPDPDIVLFDEPMSALDATTRLTMREELKSLQKKLGTTMVYITHDQEEAFALSDRVMVMSEAIIHQLGTPKEIIESPKDEYVVDFVINNINLKIASLQKFIKKQ